ncbi:hypothetical protein NIES25_36570 [Nostoc linckia NIES-25]|nr:hypothetical protein NIES25_36570 [Nostoc linckia NIES-25]
MGSVGGEGSINSLCAHIPHFQTSTAPRNKPSIPNQRNAYVVLILNIEF